MSTRLIDPSDDALNEAFAEKVAGWFRAERLGKQVLYDPEGGHVLIGDTRCMPSFTTSADAVLPWLEKWPLTNIQHCPGAGAQWIVDILEKGGEGIDSNYFRGGGATFPKSAVIALLRAHGVEIEFTK